MLHKSKNLARILVYKIWKCHFKESVLEMHVTKLHFIKFTMYRYLHQYRQIWQLLYWYYNRYQQIWKSEISVVIGMGQYEKRLIGRTLSTHMVNWDWTQIALTSIIYQECLRFLVDWKSFSSWKLLIVNKIYYLLWSLGRMVFTLPNNKHQKTYKNK